MEPNISFPLILAVISLLSVPLFKFMPMRSEMQLFRHGIVIENLAIGLYCLVITLISYYCKLGMDVVLCLVVGGAFGIGIIVMIPTVIRMVKDLKAKKDKDNFIE